MRERERQRRSDGLQALAQLAVELDGVVHDRRDGDERDEDGNDGKVHRRVLDDL